MSDLTTHLRALAEEWYECCNDIHIPINEAADALEAAEAWKKGATTVIERWQACWDEVAHELDSPPNLGRLKSVVVREWIATARAKLAAIDRFTAESLMTEPGGNFEAGYDEACLDIRAILHPEETA